jgi:hypothetical protein
MCMAQRIPGAISCADVLSKNRLRRDAVYEKWTADLESIQSVLNGAPSSVISYFVKSVAIAFGSGGTLRDNGPNSS